MCSGTRLPNSSYVCEFVVLLLAVTVLPTECVIISFARMHILFWLECVPPLVDPNFDHQCAGLRFRDLLGYEGMEGWRVILAKNLIFAVKS